MPLARCCPWTVVPGDGNAVRGDGTVAPKTDGNNTPVPQDGVELRVVPATRAWESIHNPS